MRSAVYAESQLIKLRFLDGDRLSRRRPNGIAKGCGGSTWWSVNRTNDVSESGISLRKSRNPSVNVYWTTMSLYCQKLQKLRGCYGTTSFVQYASTALRWMLGICQHRFAARRKNKSNHSNCVPHNLNGGMAQFSINIGRN